MAKRKSIKYKRASWKDAKRLSRVYIIRSLGAFINIIDDELAPPNVRLKAATILLDYAKPKSKSSKKAWKEAQDLLEHTEDKNGTINTKE